MTYNLEGREYYIYNKCAAVVSDKTRPQLDRTQQSTHVRAYRSCMCVSQLTHQKEKKRKKKVCVSQLAASACGIVLVSVVATGGHVRGRFVHLRIYTRVEPNARLLWLRACINMHVCVKRCIESICILVVVRVSVASQILDSTPHESEYFRILIQCFRRRFAFKDVHRY